MPDRLSSLDASFLYLEEATTPMHVGSVMVFDPPSDGFDYDRLVQLISTRIAFVPRYRQRIISVPGRLAGPVWVDDEDFDLTYHVRRSALPRPGSMEQLRELTARIVWPVLRWRRAFGLPSSPRQKRPTKAPASAACALRDAGRSPWMPFAPWISNRRLKKPRRRKNDRSGL